ncbi:MAG: M23 family metallopeptidase [Candidatus Hydrothermia bacterium]|nr:M23 family metallopeptidase [Candidatus Hydrothermia bacterium]
MQKWSLKIKVLFPTTKKRETEVTLKPWALRGLICSGSVLFVFAVVAIVRYVSFEADRYSVRKLESENRKLKDEIAYLKKEAVNVNKMLNELFDANNRLRAATGLDPFPKEFLLMGKGGNIEELSMESKDEAEYLRQELDRLVNVAKFQLESFSEVSSKLEKDIHLREHTPSIMPIAGYYTSGFGMRRDPFTGMMSFHEGLDIAAPQGTPVVAPAAGVIRSVKWDQGYGLTIEIDHGLGIMTRYAHLLRARVSPGHRVKRGDIIGYVGNSGRSTAPHVHYEVRINDKAVNPIKYIIPPGIYYD